MTLKLFSMIAFILLQLNSTTALALVSSPIVISEGKSDIRISTILERGKIEPNESESSFQIAEINVISLGAGQNIGSCLGLLDCYISLEGSYFSSKEEAAGGTVFYPRDDGGFFAASFGFNVVHVPEYAMGFFIQTMAPFGMDLEKFSNPSIDYLSVGANGGIRLSSKFTFESKFYLGSGAPPNQNSRLALFTLFGYEASENFYIKAGPYLENDLSQREDSRYDAVYSAPGRKDRIRSAKVGFGVFPSIKLITDTSLELSYVQKIGGYDAKATQFYSFTLRRVF